MHRDIKPSNIIIKKEQIQTSTTINNSNSNNINYNTTGISSYKSNTSKHGTNSYEYNVY